MAAHAKTQKSFGSFFRHYLADSTGPMETHLIKGLTVIRGRLALPVLGFCTLQLTACFPRQAPATPAVETRVVDASTGHPIEDALVVAWSDGSPSRKSSAKTNSDGFVRLPIQQRTIWMPPIPFDFAYPPGHVRFSAAGYQSLELNAGEITMEYLRSRHPVALTAASAN